MAAPPDYDPSAFPPFAVTVDVVVFTIREGRLHVALIERGNEPHKGKWALPGGFVEPHEGLATAAARELAEETGIETGPTRLEQLGAYGDPDRDPRMRVVSVVYWTVLADLDGLRGGSDAATAQAVAVDDALADPTGLAFDHRLILGDAVEALRDSIGSRAVATNFCPAEFTIDDLRVAYEAVWGVNIDPESFRKRVTESPGLVMETGRQQDGDRDGPAMLYRPGPADEIDPPLRRHELSTR